MVRPWASQTLTKEGLSGPLDAMRPRSFFTLGFLFVRQLIARALGQSSGIAAFDENYKDDRLFPLTIEEKRSLPQWSGCISCGLCDASFDAWEKVDLARFTKPSDLPRVATRSLPDLDAAAPFVAELRKGDLAALTAVCPTSVPFEALADFVERRGGTS